MDFCIEKEKIANRILTSVCMDLAFIDDESANTELLATIKSEVRAWYCANICLNRKSCKIGEYLQKVL